MRPMLLRRVTGRLDGTSDGRHFMPPPSEGWGCFERPVTDSFVIAIKRRPILYQNLIVTHHVRRWANVDRTVPLLARPEAFRVLAELPDDYLKFSNFKSFAPAGQASRGQSF